MTQTTFTQALLDPEVPVPAGLIRPDGRPAEKRFKVYRNNVVTSLIEALQAGFPTVNALVGDEFFRAMAGIFVRQHPPSSPLMTHYGAALPDFLAGFPPAQGLPYLADVARLEVLTRESLHSTDMLPDTDALARLPQERLGEVVFELLPSVRTIASPYPILGILEKAMGRGGAPAPGADELLLVRPEMTVTSHRLPAGGAHFVETLLSGANLGTAAEAMPEGFDLPAALTTLLSARAIGAAKLP